MAATASTPAAGALPGGATVASVGADPRVRATKRTASSRLPHPPRADIQALRAFAVAAVVVFHVWPHALTGGYIGVDVFFVISGYLITGQLVRLRERGGLRLSAFWAARARRLLPAALLVLAASTVLTLLFAPPALVTQYLRSIVGSTLYVENWVLAADAVDYLGADNAPPIAQHYWSLSVEEQFYILWPLLVIAATSAAIARGRGRRALLVTLGTVTAASLVLSLVTTFTAPSFAYFATPVRMWEFGFGALVAVLPAIAVPRAARAVIWLAGWLALIGSALIFGPTTPFPGYAAILPVAATAALILIGPTPPFAAARLQAWRPVQWLGDNSYGIYLWHWPLIVIAPAVLGAELDLWQNVLLVVLTAVLAALGKRYVEDPLRFGRLTSFRPRTILWGTAAAMVVVTAAAGVPALAISASEQERTAQAQTEIADPDACRGANLLLGPDCAGAKSEIVDRAELIPGLAGLYDDTDGAFACYTQSAAPIEPCHLGSEAPDAVRIAVTGDSHAAMLVPALRDVAEDAGWSIDVYVGRGCAWSSDPDPACAERRTALDADLLAGGYDAILVTAWNQIDADASERAERGAQFADRWRAAQEAGVRVIPVLDNPAVPQAAADCLAEQRDFSYETCAFSAADFLREDPLSIAARDAGITPIDLRGAFCDPEGVCPMVAGGVVVYRDLHHITATFSHSLAPYLRREITALVPDSAPTS
ncbi:MULTISPECIES: acyltransferase family protein [Microbacterium]|uniref:acyltransferase family protein n=1 Tax=Microbacterium TaxID=33882 RepID=UPI0009E9D1EB|nr:MULTISPECIES: acyltransferase family protein [Microbacterium]QXE31005.1 acyltransferase [Microbacterium paraoxydans]RUQ04786.1 acyltransferase [Microbacterium sp. HSID17254]